MKKLICLTLALLLCLSGFALGEEDDGTHGVMIEYPSLGFTLRLLNEYTDHLKGLINPGLAFALDSESNFLQILMGGEPAKTTEVGIFTATYICLTQEEYEANAESADAEAQSRNLDAEMPFINLLIIKDGLSQEDVERIVGAPVDMSTMKVQAKVDGYTFYKGTAAAKKELPDPAFFEEYAELMSHLDDILDSCDYYPPYDPYAEKLDANLIFETTDLDGNYIASAELVGSHEYTLLNTKNVETKEVSDKEDHPTYTVRVVDQNGDPVPEAAVIFCLDTGCVPVETDENGVAIYSGAPARYHIQVVDAPDEYDYPDDTDTYIGPESGEMTLVITKE